MGNKYLEGYKLPYPIWNGKGGKNSLGVCCEAPLKKLLLLQFVQIRQISTWNFFFFFTSCKTSLSRIREDSFGGRGGEWPVS